MDHDGTCLGLRRMKSQTVKLKIKSKIVDNQLVMEKILSRSG